MKDKLMFFLTFLKNPGEVGSITPSSKFLTDSMINNIDFSNAGFIAEYGSGTGIITREIIKRAKKDAKILCFETNRKLCTYLKKSIKDKRAIIINDGAENIKSHMKRHNIPRIDYVLAVLSFSTLGAEKKADIMEETKNALRDGGRFVFCRYLPHFEKNLRKYFSRNFVKFIPFNIPPSLVYVCEK